MTSPIAGPGTGGGASSVDLAFVIHNHQPVGNFDAVIEQATRDAYDPFLDFLLAHPWFRMTLHYSGCLLEWLEAKRPDVVGKISRLVERRQVELMGGGFYEPILAMWSDRDKIEQVRSFREHLEKRFRTRVRTAWIAERIWETSLVRPLAAAGVESIVLDDFHFLLAGREPGELDGGYMTEDQGTTLRVFPGLEWLRYKIPFAPADPTAEAIRAEATKAGDRVLVYADDGEKFGMWPGTKRLVYENGWLKSFARALIAVPGTIRFVTLSEAAARPARGRIYLPDASYREMLEWSLPPARGEALARLEDALRREGKLDAFRSFLRGGYFRNFQVKYPESGWMHARGIGISDRIAAAAKASPRAAGLEEANRSLYRGQCNCAYWHGVFGGLYLVHLRDAIWRNLLDADERVSALESRRPSVETADLDFDGAPEVRLQTDAFRLFFKPDRGGTLFEWDVRPARFNVLATMARRREAYHAKVAAAEVARDPSEARTIHDTMTAKHAGLERLLTYDPAPRASFVTWLLPEGAAFEAIRDGRTLPEAGFHRGAWTFDARANGPERSIRLAREGHAIGRPIRIEKRARLREGERAIETVHEIKNLGPEPFHGILAMEWNFNLLAAKEPSSRYLEVRGAPAGDVSTSADFPGLQELALVDTWQRLRFSLRAEGAEGFWVFPVETVTQSESGYEANYQSTAVLAHWRIALPPGGSASFLLAASCEGPSEPAAAPGIARGRARRRK
ncbi:MAG: alpha-amylase/4-alpha-glucanotransferase domain-containing protein [Planctomycetota bacterium]